MVEECGEVGEKLREQVIILSQEKKQLIMLFEESDKKLVETLAKTKEENEKLYELINDFMVAKRGGNGKANNKEKLIEFLSGEARPYSIETKPSTSDCKEKLSVEANTQTEVDEGFLGSQRQEEIKNILENTFFKLSKKLTEMERLAKSLNLELEVTKAELQKEQQASAGKVESSDYQDISGRLISLQGKYEMLRGYFGQLYNKYNMGLSENACLRLYLEELLVEPQPSQEKGFEKSNPQPCIPDPIPGFLRLYRMVETQEKKASAE